MIGLLIPLRQRHRVAPPVGAPGCVHIEVSGPTVRQTIEAAEVVQAFAQAGNVRQTFEEAGSVEQTLTEAGSVRITVEEC